MGKNADQVAPMERSIYTLAQKGTDQTVPEMLLLGEGAELGNEKTMKGKAKRKIITQVMALNLIKVAESKKNT